MLFSVARITFCFNPISDTLEKLDYFVKGPVHMMVGSLANTSHLSRWWSGMVLSVWTDMGILGNTVSSVFDNLQHNFLYM